jgi:hypothetical protein
MAEVADGPEKKHPHHLEECLDWGSFHPPGGINFGRDRKV